VKPVVYPNWERKGARNSVKPHRKMNFLERGTDFHEMEILRKSGPGRPGKEEKGEAECLRMKGGLRPTRRRGGVRYIKSTKMSKRGGGQASQGPKLNGSNRHIRRREGGDDRGAKKVKREVELLEPRGLALIRAVLTASTTKGEKDSELPAAKLLGGGTQGQAQLDLKGGEAWGKTDELWVFKRGYRRRCRKKKR